MLTYVVTDCEFDGPTPGLNSLLSFASVAVTEAGAKVGEFEAVLHPLEGASADPINLAFLQKNADVWAATTTNAQPPEAEMKRFASWVAALPGESIFAAHPLAVDGPWIDFYLQRFQQRRICDGPWVTDRLFRHLPVCIVSFASGRLAWPITQCDVRHYPKEWLGNVPHSHKAIDDARGYANLLGHLLNAPQPLQP
jgi:DNA polymerase III alpha subunit (gram-positive type)